MSDTAATRNRWGVLSAAFVVLFFVAAIALFSVFLNPLAEEHGWSKTDITLSFSIFQTVMAITGIFAGRFSDRFGPRTVLLVGGFMFGLGWFLAGTVTTLPLLYLTHGVIAGMGNGLVYSPALTTAQRWFPDIRGKASGILLAGAAIGPALLAPIANGLISSYGVSTALKILGISFGVAITVGGLFVAPIPSGYRPANWQASASDTAATTNGFDWKAMVTNSRFYLMLAIFAAAATSGTMLVGAVSSIAQDQVGAVGAMDAAAFGALVVSISTIANFAGRLTFGVLYDKLGAYYCLLIMMAMTLVAMLSMSFATGPVIFVTCVIVLGFSFGALLVIYPPLTGQTFGTQHLGMNYGIMFLGYAIGAWIGPRIATSLFSEEHGYRNAFFVAAGIVAVGIGIAAVLTARTKQAGTLAVFHVADDVDIEPLTAAANEPSLTK